MYGILQTMLGKKLPSADRYKAWENTYTPSVDYKFPVNQTAKATGKTRKFQYSWLRMYPWLAYSPKEDGAYCKACVLFGNTVHASSDCNSSRLHRLVIKPLQLWSSAVSKLKEHDTQ